MKRNTWLFFQLISLLGVIDAAYLTYEHYSNFIPPCGVGGFFNDCGKVLTSVYATPFGIPLALIGLCFYTFEYLLITQVMNKKNKRVKLLLNIVSTGGFVGSLLFIYLQVGVIHALCKYCMASALISTAIFILVQYHFGRERKQLIAIVMGFLYRNLLKPIFFLMDPEKVHVSMVAMGKLMGDLPGIPQLFAFLLRINDPRLMVEIPNSPLYSPLSILQFPNRVGLAAGFDYEANLTQILGPLGFGFQTIGTITNHPYHGNPRPMLGRLPKSQSLMVNKGFKNLGAKATIAKLEGKKFPIQVGISIGVTNSAAITDQKVAIEDIITTFQAFERSTVSHSYYELNISCPNLQTKVSFFPPQSLQALLLAVKKLNLTRPVFIKMPIDESTADIESMLAVIAKSTATGVIFGNLSHNRNNPSIDPSEVNKYSVGNFSGKPTWDRSNELISLTHKHYRDRLVIIGCGGIFSVADAKEKLRRGATLVQLITGMIYEGPQLISEITSELVVSP